MSALHVIREKAGDVRVEAIIVLGSGLSGLADILTDQVRIPYARLEGFPGTTETSFGSRGSEAETSGVSGHGSDLVIGTMGQRKVAILTGREHYYENGNAAAMRPALETLAALGAKTLLLTNSAGSMDREVHPGNLMLIRDHINYAGMNPLIGEPTDRRFVNLVDAYDPSLRATTLRIARELGIPLKEGVYLWYSGPSFETVAEIEMAMGMGATLVGMSTAPEVILGRMLGLRVWACSAITNMAAGLSDEKISHEHTKTGAKVCAQKMLKLIPALVETL